MVAKRSWIRTTSVPLGFFRCNTQSRLTIQTPDLILGKPGREANGAGARLVADHVQRYGFPLQLRCDYLVIHACHPGFVDVYPCFAQNLDD